MSFIISPTLNKSLLPSLTTALLPYSTPMPIPQAETSEETPLIVATSNVREGFSSPDHHEEKHHVTSLVSHTRTTLCDDSLYSLPPPDITPRFAFKSDDAALEGTMSISISDEESDAPQGTHTPSYDLSSPPPRIYFADSAIMFVPPLCYDYLQRDPSVKGVPRNYRAWARSGRPKMDVDGAERPEAKNDFAAMGLTYPHDTESEGSGDEKEKEKKRKRKKKLAARAQFVPMERPRRMARKLMEAAGQPATQSPADNQPTISMREDSVSEEPDQQAEAIVQSKEEAKVEIVSDVAMKSDSSEEGGSSSTLLDTDMVESSIKLKRKRAAIDPPPTNILRPNKQRSSKRLIIKRSKSHERKENATLVNETSPPAPYQTSSLETTPPAEDSVIPAPQVSTPQVSAPQVPTRSNRRQTSLAPPPTRLRKITGESNSAVDNTSKSAPLPASRPGHRINRASSSAQSQTVPQRTFPPTVPIISGYSGFYRRYPLITQFDRDDPLGQYINVQDDSLNKRSLGNWNAPRDPRDLYTPRFTKGSGNKKIALCPLCFEDPARGGEGRQEWNHTKTSQHNYHMQYYHGISATRCAPFSPPISQKIVSVGRPQSNEKSEILQGKCHNCKQWIPLEGCKLGELKVKELFWWKHAAGCHKDSYVSGETDIFIEDDAYHRLQEYEAGSSNQS